MTLEVLLSTMNQTDMNILFDMNIHSNALIINQNQDSEKIDKHVAGEYKYRMISKIEKGLSKSRNHAIRNATGEICLIADDDLVYNDNYVKTVLDAYIEYPEADMIAFYVGSLNDNRPTTRQKTKKLGLLYSLKISSVQVSFKLSSIKSHALQFNEYFGAGSTFVCGEENIFLAQCLKAGLKIMYVDKEIAIVKQNESSWFKGFDENYLKTKGAMFFEISHSLHFLLILQYAIRKYGLYSSNLGFFKALKTMLIGKNEYLRLRNKG